MRNTVETGFEWLTKRISLRKFVCSGLKERRVWWVKIGNRKVHAAGARTS